MYGVLVASLGLVTLMLAANETSARPGPAARAGVVARHSISNPSVAHLLRRHRRNIAGIFWPATADFSYGPSDGEPLADTTRPASDNVHYTYTYDVPWDWAHRYPPAVAPSDRPYVSSCPTENVTVRGRDGKEQTVNVTRCY